MTRRRSRRTSRNGNLAFAVALGVLALIYWIITTIVVTIQSTWADLTSLEFFRMLHALFVIQVSMTFLFVVYVAVRWTRYRRRRTITSYSELMTLTPTEFEFVVGDILTAYGYRNLQRVGGAGDLGADLIGQNPRGERIIAQCKLYAPHHRVSSPEVQLFLGATYIIHRAAYGVYVTTSTFTQPAQDLARQYGIITIDGTTLSRMVDRIEPPAKWAWLIPSFPRLPSIIR